MMAVLRITAVVNFLHREDGGRLLPACDSPSYRPHLVVENQAQGSASVRDNDAPAERYLGIQFTGDGREMLPGVEHEVRMDLLYSPKVDYSGLVRGATFTIREGGRTVGFGRVLRQPERQGGGQQRGSDGP